MMTSRELLRRKAERKATVQQLALTAKERDWYVPSPDAVKDQDAASRRLRKQAVLKRRRLPKLYRNGSIVDMDATDERSTQKENIKEDILSRDAEYGGITDTEIFKRSSRRAHMSINDADILERIVVRENLLLQIAEAVKSRQAIQSHIGDDESSLVNDYGDLVPLLASLRHCTVDIIEHIRCWQTFLPNASCAFLFRGSNYLLKIASDLDYLDANSELIRYFGFSFVGNPFGYLGGGVLSDPDGLDNDINGYFHMQLSVGGVELARLRSCERDIQRERKLQDREVRPSQLRQEHTHSSSINTASDNFTENNGSNEYKVQFKVDKYVLQ
jgi:hypothetical protein